MTVTLDIEKVWSEQLYESRLCFKIEMQRVIQCHTNDEKIALLETWKKTYSEGRVNDLIKCAKDKVNRVKVANWQLGQFGDLNSLITRRIHDRL
jgi:hypothetical protein